MKYNTKSVLIARKKEKDDTYTALVRLFKMNDPHLTDDMPEEFLDYKNTLRVIIKNCDVKYALLGNDIILNDLTAIEISKDEESLTITCS